MKTINVTLLNFFGLLFFCSFAQKSAFTKTADSLFLNGAYKGAIEQYKKAIAEDPGFGRNYFRRGQCFFQLKKYTEAERDFRKSISIGKNTQVMFQLCRVLAIAGKKDSLVKWMNTLYTAGFNQSNQLNEQIFDAYKKDKSFIEIKNKIDLTCFPCMSKAETKQFDFWVGEWTVGNGTGPGNAKSFVQKILGSCVVFENWTDAFGGEGKSFNVFDSINNRWQQTWVDDKGTLTEYYGNLRGDSMVLTTKALPQAGGKNLFRRMTFSPQKDGRVRQHGEVSNDGISGWTTEFDLYYTRKGA